MTGVSVIIKALNEESNIAKAIESALRAIASVGGEVILADALSDDRTVEIARRFPITIVQLVRAADRGCGSGPQLGFQHARGKFIYLMDGDMELHAGFIEAALPHLRSEDDVAGVGGVIEYPGVLGIEYRQRHLRQIMERPGYVSHLGCGGLYRTDAIRRVGYLSNRNLHSFEELELGLRLRSARWKLKRIDKSSVRHHTHQLGGYSFLARRRRDKFALGAGELLRSAIGKPYLPSILKELRNLFIVACWMVMLVAALLVPMSFALRLAVFFGLLAAPVMVVSIRRRSLRMGIYTIAALCTLLVEGIRGAARSQVDPSTPIDSRVLQRHEWLHPVSTTDGVRGGQTVHS
jgi:glycosyltransferase involved in cell wall biosynthesis